MGLKSASESYRVLIENILIEDSVLENIKRYELFFMSFSTYSVNQPLGKTRVLWYING